MGTCAVPMNLWHANKKFVIHSHGLKGLTGIPVRADVAMTGEITLRGEVLQIGGLKEKLLAAHRGGIKTVLIPDENVKDLVDIPDNVKNKLEILPVKWIDKVLEVALERQPAPLPEHPSAAAAANAAMNAALTRRICPHCGARDCIPTSSEL